MVFFNQIKCFGKSMERTVSPDKSDFVRTYSISFHLKDKNTHFLKKIFVRISIYF
jgi:hypothetical protein